jgi:hypothetical protein
MEITIFILRLVAEEKKVKHLTDIITKERRPLLEMKVQRDFFKIAARDIYN